MDDHELVRLGIRAVLDDMPETFEIVAEASSAEEGIQQVIRHQPEIVLMDVRMPGMGGIEACRQIMGVSPQTKVIMLSAYGDDELLFEAIRAGAAGYVIKDVDSQALIHTLRGVMQGEGALSPSLVYQVFNELRRRVGVPAVSAEPEPPAATMGAKALVNFLAAHFDLEEMEEVCFQMSIDEQKGTSRRSRARAIVSYAERHGRLAELETLLRQLRPNIKR